MGGCIRVQAIIGRAARALAIGALAVLVAGSASADQASEAFIQERAGRVMEILNGSGSPAQKKADLEGTVEESVALESIALYTLGQYRANASRDDLDRYVAAFKDFVFAYYISPAAGFSGITLSVTGSTDGGGRVAIVHTTAKTKGAQSFELDWYVASGSAIVDVEISGVSAAKLLRAQVLAVLALNGGKISAATDLLQTLTHKS
jgi:phospholipid transport system substrate-binding protein